MSERGECRKIKRVINKGKIKEECCPSNKMKCSKKNDPMCQMLLKDELTKELRTGSATWRSQITFSKERLWWLGGGKPD